MKKLLRITARDENEVRAALKRLGRAEHHTRYRVQTPPGVEVVGSYAFNGCTGLVSVVISPVVKIIGAGAFADCTSLVSVDIPLGVTYIGPYAFDGCTSLVSFGLPVGVGTIGDYAFYRCSGLMRVDIPPGVTYIGTRAFGACSGLAKIYIPPGVTYIGINAFLACAVTSITIPSTVAVHMSAFEKCDHLVVAICDRQDVFDVLGCLPLVIPWGEPSKKKRDEALSLFNWSVGTHRLCSPARRAWVGNVMLCAARLHASALELPNEMWWAILEQVPRWALGSVA